MQRYHKHMIYSGILASHEPVEAAHRAVLRAAGAARLSDEQRIDRNDVHNLHSSSALCGRCMRSPSADRASMQGMTHSTLNPIHKARSCML